MLYVNGDLTMENCSKCKYLATFKDRTYCRINQKEITIPIFMGGSKKCQCYTKKIKIKIKEKFCYPTHEELELLENESQKEK